MKLSDFTVGTKFRCTKNDSDLLPGWDSKFKLDFIDGDLEITYAAGPTFKFKKCNGNKSHQDWVFNVADTFSYIEILPNLPPKPVVLKFNVSDIIKPTDIEDMLLAGHTTSFMLDARECNFQIYGLDMSGEIKLIRADNKPTRESKQFYITNIEKINNCFELVSNNKTNKSKQTRLTLIDQ